MAVDFCQRLSGDPRCYLRTDPSRIILAAREPLLRNGVSGSGLSVIAVCALAKSSGSRQLQGGMDASRVWF